MIRVAFDYISEAWVTFGEVMRQKSNFCLYVNINSTAICSELKLFVEQLKSYRIKRICPVTSDMVNLVVTGPELILNYG